MRLTPVPKPALRKIVFIYSDDTNKSMYEHYFSPNKQLEERLLRSDKLELWEALKRTVPAGVKFSFACQPEPKGNGHAILCAKDIIGKRDFMVMWVDDVYVCRGKGFYRSCLTSMNVSAEWLKISLNFPKTSFPATAF